MIKPFKLLNGYTYSDEYTIPNLDHPIWRDNPPFDISRRHWNMMPQDLRGGTLIHMEIYIEGWEAGRNNININPYEGIINDPVVTEWIELWNRGHLRWSGRTGQNFRNVNPNPPIDETYPEFYNTDEYVFFDVTEVMDDLDQFGRPYKFMLFRHIEEGNTVQGSRITPEHPMYNFPNII
jgi:hypothetical protein